MCVSVLIYLAIWLITSYIKAGSTLSAAEVSIFSNSHILYFKAYTMLKSNLKVVNNDMKSILKDAQALFQAALTLTGGKADEVCHQGMRLLDTALLKVQDAQLSALVAGREMVVSADDYVKENPWRVIATAASVGFLAGIIFSRK
jgi:ElaB/YqjD/DUF883 family membrane-anchored ribosome-binding protein